MDRKKALLVLANGAYFEGYAFGDTSAIAEGEVVFTTAMTGYQEVLTDPSYKGQLITFTYPHIGNYGVNEYDEESSAIHAEGIVVREYSKTYSNWRAGRSLGDYLASVGKIGIEGIDTRRLVRILRSEGAMQGIIAAETTLNDLLEKVRHIPSMEGADLTGAVTRPAIEAWTASQEPYIIPAKQSDRPCRSVGVLDFGVKTNILRRLAAYNCEITVYPASTPAQTIINAGHDGLMASNGPGDPAAAEGAIDLLKKLIDSGIPIFGICLGHQLLSLAFEATTYKMSFGHRGSNHPVRNMLTGAVEITSQNHGFAVELASMGKDIELTHINLNDNTVAGFRHTSKPIFCVQYHPEASPGTHDSEYLFAEFMNLIDAHLQKS